MSAIKWSAGGVLLGAALVIWQWGTPGWLGLVALSVVTALAMVLAIWGGTAVKQLRLDARCLLILLAIALTVCGCGRAEYEIAKWWISGALNPTANYLRVSELKRRPGCQVVREDHEGRVWITCNDGARWRCNGSAPCVPHEWED
jgi:hypothetical protein